MNLYTNSIVFDGCKCTTIITEDWFAYLHPNGRFDKHTLPSTPKYIVHYGYSEKVFSNLQDAKAFYETNDLSCDLRIEE